MIEQKLIVGRWIDVPLQVPVNNGPAVGGFQPLNNVMLHINESTRMSAFGAKTSTVTTGHIAKNNRNYQWLEWLPGLVSEVSQFNVDVMTGPMTGCWITRYVRNGLQCVGHVGTYMEANHEHSIAARASWNAFAAAGGVITGFNPQNGWVGPFPPAKTGDGAFKIFAVVTSAGDFWTIFTYADVTGANRVRIAGTQEIQTASLATLQAL
ncbi:MAG: hypothetical protein HRU06_04745 [Oceanospirillaceae bacterium]|nr:hypothetical protein [Oceanospirillaceae bacterium]